MDKKLVCAVAGSGKTTSIIDRVARGGRCHIITYTNENVHSLRSSLEERFGRIPDNVTLQSYFSFLYSYCFRPFFSYDLNDRSYLWEAPGPATRRFRKSELGHYMTRNRYLYANRVAKMIIEYGAVPKVIQRLEKFCDTFMVDEVQDFAANDFNLLLEIINADIDVLLVGDFYQHTFDTSKDGNTRQNLHKRGIDPFLKEFAEQGIQIDVDSLSKSYRCSPDVCRFITENIGIPIESHRTDETYVEVVDSPERAQEIYADDRCVKLFYSGSGDFQCRSNNWGKCKGLNTYTDVCVVLNKTACTHFTKGTLPEMAPSSLNKLYVACSRARGNLYVVDIAKCGLPARSRAS